MFLLNRLSNNGGNSRTVPGHHTVTVRGARAPITPFACVIGDISMVRALGIRQLPVAVATDDPSAKSVHSRYCRAVVVTPSWVSHPDNALAAIIEWAKAQATPPVLFYQGDHDLVAVSRHRERLAPYFRLVLPRADLVEDLTDKLRFHALAMRNDLPVPDTMSISSRSSVNDILHAWNAFPCVFKPTMRTRWDELAGNDQKALRLQTVDELEGVLARIQDSSSQFLLQASVEGGEENVLSYHAYVRPDGETVAEFTGRKIRTSPKLYGYSTYVEITDDPEVRGLGRSIVEKLGFSGVLKIDFKRDARNGRLYILEINPRFNLWHHPGTVAGAAIPEAVYWDCVEPERVPPLRSVKKGVRWMALADVRAFKEHHRAGELSWTRWLYEAATVDVNEGINIRDPIPFIMDCGHRLKSKIAVNDAERG